MSWRIYRGTGVARSPRQELPEAPSWRRYNGVGTTEIPDDDGGETDRRIGDQPRLPSPDEVDLVNAAILLRRPLVLTGMPGSGKSCIAYAVARELALGPVLRWTVTTRSTLADGLYRVTGERLRLGPLGTALLPYDRPRVLLIDELDRAPLDLPEEILALLESGEFIVDELAGPEHASVTTHDNCETTLRSGRVRCRAFPIVIITCVGERDFSLGLLGRCLRLRIPPPTHDQLVAFVAAQVGDTDGVNVDKIVAQFLVLDPALGVPQLLNAVHLAKHAGDEWPDLVRIMWHVPEPQ